MKRYGQLWESVTSWENLLQASRQAQRGKRGKRCVQRFNFGLEIELMRLHRELLEDRYRPGLFVTHWIQRPKPRLISAAPYRDRVVHHALINVLEPILERHFHEHSYACRKGKDTHAAVDRLQKLMRHHRYALQCDIRKFFPSIDHAIMKQKFRRLIKDRRVLELMDRIVDHSNAQELVLDWFAGDDLFAPSEHARGLPIGNLTSQWFANWYLNDLDHFVTKNLGMGAYVRYCDDFLLLSTDREPLVDAREAIKERLAMDRLKLHERKLFIKPVRAGITFVGYRTWPEFRLLRKDNVRRFRRRLKWMKQSYAEGHIEWEDIKTRLDSWIAHASHTNSHTLMERLSEEWVFQRAAV